MKDFSRRSVGRRRFIQGSSTLALLSAVHWPASAVAQARHGGILSLAITSDPPSYDPISNTASFVINVVAPCYNNLVRYDPQDSANVVGDLAESWSVSEDGLIYTFQLKQNVQFHDGMPFSAEDVRATFNRIRNPPVTQPSVRQDLLVNVDAIEVSAPHTVVFSLKQPQAAFLKILAVGWFVVLPKHILDSEDGVGRNIVGTGPFRFKSHQQGVSVELERNPDYHEPGLPYLDGMTFYVLPDRSTSFAYLRTGQLHLVDGMDGEDALRVKSEFGDQVEVLQVPSFSVSNIMMNTRLAPFDDIRVREAVSLAVDREDGLLVLRQGFGQVGSLMPPGPWGLQPSELPEIAGHGGTRDEKLERARQLLAEAGYSDGLDVSMTTRRQGTFEAQAVWFQSQVAPIGMRISLDFQESAAYFENLNSGNFVITPYARTIDVDDPSYVFGGIHSCTSALNYTGVCVPELDALLAADLQAESFEERKQIADQMNRLILTQYAELPLFWRDRFLPVSRKVHGVYLHPSPDNNRRFDQVWLEE